MLVLDLNSRLLNVQVGVCVCVHQEFRSWEVCVCSSDLDGPLAPWDVKWLTGIPRELIRISQSDGGVAAHADKQLCWAA